VEGYPVAGMLLEMDKLKAVAGSGPNSVFVFWPCHASIIPIQEGFGKNLNKCLVIPYTTMTYERFYWR
jgi:hypothetical protein